MTDMICEAEPRHDEIMQLLPWYANGSLEPGEHRAVTGHLKTCAVCRAELVDIELIQTQWQRQPASVEVGDSFARLMARIEASEVKASAGSASADTMRAAANRATEREAASDRPRRGRLVEWFSGLLGSSNTFLPLAAMASALLFTMIGMRSWLASESAGYRTLGSPVTDGGVGNRDLRIVFAPSATIDQVVKLVESLDARIVDGPTEPGAFTLRLNGPTTTESAVPQVAARLRTDPAVIYVAPALALVPND